MKFIPLTKGRTAIVDDADYEWLSLSTWYFSGSGYAAREFTRNKEKVLVLMHRLIMDAPEDKEVDHIDGNRLNNTRANLRICTRLENSHNARPREGCSSKYKGVYWSKSREYYRVEITTKAYGKICLGSFYSEDEAGLAYNLAATSLYGEFAYLNTLPSNVCLPFEHKVEKSRSSQHVGVSFDKRHTGKWYAYIDHNRKRVWCGRFKTEDDAHKARQEKLIELGLA